MEKIVLRGKEYKNLASGKSIQKNMIFHNDNLDILVYNCRNNIILPNVVTNNEEQFTTELHQKFNFQFQDEDIEYLLQLIDYEQRFERQNNKLKKKYLEIIRDYYCCLTKLESGVEQKLLSVESSTGDIYIPKVIQLEEVINTFGNNRPNFSQTLYGLNYFKQKVKEKK